MAKKSKRKGVGLIALLAVLVILCGLYFVVSRLDLDGNDVDTIPAATTATVFAADAKTFSAISYLCEGEQLSFTLENGSWRWEGNPTLSLDAEAFTAMIGALESVTSSVKIDSPDTEKLAEFGLDAPRQQVTFTDKMGTHTLLIGGYNSFNHSYYAARNNTDTVYMIDGTVAGAFGMPITDLVLYDTLPLIVESEISAMTVTRGADRLTYTFLGAESEDGFWHAAQGDNAPRAISVEAGEKLSSMVSYLEFTDCVSLDRGADAAKYGLDAPAEMTIDYRTLVQTTDSAGNTVSTEVDKTLTLLLGAVDPESGCYYATLPESGLIYLLTSAVSPDLMDPSADLPYAQS